MSYQSKHTGQNIDIKIDLMPELQNQINNLSTQIDILNNNVLTKQNYLDIIYPIGSIYTTNTNINPSTSLTIGTWALVDKEFSFKKINIADVITLNKTNCTSLTGQIIRNNHFLSVYFSLNPKVAITDSTLQMGTFNLSNIGVSSLYSQSYSSMSDGGQAIFTYNISASGVFSTTDVIVRGSSTASSAAGTTLIGYCVIPISAGQMLDECCDRFFWKRTA